MTGHLIAIEGIDGSGKSTQARHLAQVLGYEATFQLGATAIGGTIRELLLNWQNEHLDYRSEALLIIADKAQHVSEVVRPALESGRNVVCDRYRASALAYQGYGRGLDLTILNEMMDFATQGLEADLTVLLDVELDATLERIGGQLDLIAHENFSNPGGDAKFNRIGTQIDRIEREGFDFFQRVVDGYRALAAASPETWVNIDGHGPIDEVSARVREEVTAWLTSRA